MTSINDLSDLARTKTDVNRINVMLDRLDGRMDNGFGINYEIKIQKNLASIAGQYP